MDIKAESKYIRVSHRKMQLLADSIKKLSPKDAVEALKFIKKSGSQPLGKLISSAISNAKRQNFSVENLRFKSINVIKGSVMKRFHAVSRGMAHSYKKRMCHVRLALIVKEPEVKPVVKSANIKPIVETKEIKKSSK